MKANTENIIVKHILESSEKIKIYKRTQDKVYKMRNEVELEI